MVYHACFALGAVAARLLAGTYALVLVGLASTAGSPWWSQPRAVSSLLMALVGLVATLLAAGAVARLDRSREQAQQLVVQLVEAQRQLAEQADQALLAGALAERNRVAREIHDGLGHHLTAVAIQLQKARAYLGRDADVAAAAVDDAQEAARQALADVRRSVAALRSQEPFDLGRAVRALAGGDDDPAPRVQVVVDGRGFTVPGGGGLGLPGMRERVDQVGGRLVVSSLPGAGTTVRARLPARPAPVVGQRR